MSFLSSSNNDKDELSRLQRQYEDKGKEIVDIVNKLYEMRKVAVSKIQLVNMYVSSLSNCPQSIKDISVEAYNFTKQFRQAIDWEIEGKKAEGSATGSIQTSNVIAGVATGTAVATMGSSVSMAIATTFGIASTGTAISSIGGIAATNAVLAWLGGGAMVGGSIGMAAGSALLALAGPIGWGIAAVAGFSIGSKSARNRKIRELIEQIKNNLEILKPKEAKLKQLLCDTEKLITEISRIDLLLKYNDFSKEDFPRDVLFRIVNQTVTLSKSINETVSMQN